MKPINAAGTGSDADAAPQPSFVESLKTIDVSSLDRLIGIGQELARIAGYRAKAEEKKKDVAEAVYVRVMQDYAKRTAALDAQSAPLRTQARAEWRKLKALLGALDARQEQAQLEKDELEFRHTVGELTNEALAVKLIEPQKVLDRCAADRKELESTKARFVEALGSEEALEATEPPAPSAAAASQPAAVASTKGHAPAPGGQPPIASEAPAAPTHAASPSAGDSTLARGAAPAPARLAASEAAAVAVAAAPTPAAAPSARPRMAEDPGETRMARPVSDLGEVTRMIPSAAQPALKPGASSMPAAAAGGAAEGTTVMLATAAIVVEGPGGKEYPLTVLNGIGRSAENRICLSSPGISRKHATINAAAGGFVIKDLGSQNGTFVNGERVTDKKLAEGDTIEVGSVKFVFHSPWPPRGDASPSREEAAAQAKR